MTRSPLSAFRGANFSAANQNGGDKIKPGDSFKGENRHGETKEDPEKALKDSRGSSGLNAIPSQTEQAGKDEVPHVSRSYASTITAS